jgi:predicted transcriptional regulator
MEKWTLQMNADLRLAALDASIARGLEDADAGRVKPVSAVLGVLGSKLKAGIFPPKAASRV